MDLSTIKPVPFRPRKPEGSEEYYRGGPPARRADRRAAFYIEGECAPWRGNETAAR